MYNIRTYNSGMHNSMFSSMYTFMENIRHPFIAPFFILSALQRHQGHDEKDGTGSNWESESSTRFQMGMSGLRLSGDTTGDV